MNNALSNSSPGCDIICDVHGHAKELKTILKKMNYRKADLILAHPTEKAFLMTIILIGVHPLEKSNADPLHGEF